MNKFEHTINLLQNLLDTKTLTDPVLRKDYEEAIKQLSATEIKNETANSPHTTISTVRRNNTFESSFETYMFSDVFRHRDLSCVQQNHSLNFVEWFIKPNQNKAITVPVTSMKLSRFVLPSDGMTGGDIESSLKYEPITEDQTIDVLYGLIVKPEIGKKLFDQELLKYERYFFYCYMNGFLCSMCVSWNNDEWECRVIRFNKNNYSSCGVVFLYLPIT